MQPFNASQTVKLTSTTSSQTVTVPTGYNQIVVYNGGTNVVYLAYAATVAVPGSSWSPGVVPVQPGTTQVFANKREGGTLAYIADSSGGTLVLSVGEGV